MKSPTDNRNMVVFALAVVFEAAKIVSGKPAPEAEDDPFVKADGFLKRAEARGIDIVKLTTDKLGT